MHEGLSGRSPQGPTWLGLSSDYHKESALEVGGGPFIQQQLGTPVWDGEGQAASHKTFPWLCKQVFVEWIHKWLNELATG